MNRISKDKQELLERVLREGKSLRQACAIVGVAKHTAHLARMKMGGMPGLEKEGVRFNRSRWGK